MNNAILPQRSVQHCLTTEMYGDLWHTVFDATHVGLIVLDPSQTIVMWNAWMSHIAGIASEAALGHTLEHVFPELLHSRVTSGIRDALQLGLPTLLSQTFHKAPFPLYRSEAARHRDERIQQMIFIKPVLPPGRSRHCLVQIVDVTSAVTREQLLRRQAIALQTEIGERQRMEDTLAQHAAELEHSNNALARRSRELAEAKELAEVTLRSIGEAVVTTDAHGCITSMNPVAEALTGWSFQEVRGEKLSLIFTTFHEATRDLLENPVEVSLREGKKITHRYGTLLICKDLSTCAIDETASPIYNQDGEVIGAVLVFRDVTQERAFQQRLSYQASHDALTGLMNRQEFERLLNNTLVRAKVEESEHILLYLDLDQFKIVNDTCGHVAGDALLQQLTALMKKRLRTSDTFARLGGDEFGILLEHCSVENGSLVAEELRKIVRNFRFVWGQKYFNVGISIGLIALNAATHSLSEVLSTADAACYIAKERGRNRLHIAQGDDTAVAQRRGEMQWVSRITRALDEDRFILYFQPFEPLQEADKGILHWEILLRMLDEEGTLVPPGFFIPAAERYNLMPSLDRWVIKKSIDTYDKLRRRVPKTAPHMISINVSGASLSEPGFLDFVCAQFERYPVPPESVCFEITETAVITHLTKAMQFIETLKKLGCRFALDDFGSGLSSFSYLKTLPVDFLKIDGGFVKDMLHEPLDYAIVKAISNISHIMKIQTIAEAVETLDLLDQLRLSDIDFAQGYAIARPAPIQLG